MTSSAGDVTPDPVVRHPLVRRDFPLAVGAEILQCDVVTADPDRAPQVLFLHGAGHSSRERQRALREQLADPWTTGLPSVACDFSGHGRSTASLPHSLHKRETEAQALLDHAMPHVATGQTAHRTVVGISMGGEIAIRLACRPGNRITHLVTLVGAIYDGTAYDLPFGPAFSAALRRPQSWRDAAVLEKIAGYTGHITLIRGTDDAVVPAEIAELVRLHAVKAASCRIVDLPGVDHRMSEHIARDAALRREVARWIASPDDAAIAPLP